MNSSKLHTIAAALAVVFSSGAAMAQTGTPGGNAGPSVSTSTPARQAEPAAQPGVGTRNAPAGDKTSQLDRGDRKFIIQAAEDGMFEVEVAKLAASRATHPELKSFAGMMVDDHTKANGELAQLANAKGVELPAAPARSKRRDLEKMAKLTGDKFDREFAKEVALEAHQKDVKMFEKASKDVKDPALKAWIDKTLPTLRAHLAAAAKLPQNAKGKS